MSCRDRCCPEGVGAWVVADLSGYYEPQTWINIAAESSWVLAFNVQTLARTINAVATTDAAPPTDGCRALCGGPVYLDVMALIQPGGNTISVLDLAISEGFTSGALYEVDLRQVPADGTALRATWRLAGPWVGITLFNGDPSDLAKVDLYAIARNA